MKKCVVNYNKNSYACFTADRLEREDGIVFVYDGQKLVGAFDLGFIDSIYLSEMKEGK